MGLESAFPPGKTRKSCLGKTKPSQFPPMNEWLHLAFQRNVVKRALKCAVIVGCVLISINHGDAILRGDVSMARVLRMALTVVVPYVVSTVSSVGAMRERKR
jgi:hypothetical protein